MLWLMVSVSTLPIKTLAKATVPWQCHVNGDYFFPFNLNEFS